MSPNIVLKEGDIDTSKLDHQSKILVIQQSDYIPNTLKVAQAIALRMPIVPYAWITHTLSMTPRELGKDGGLCYKEFMRKEIIDCGKLFEEVSI